MDPRPDQTEAQARAEKLRQKYGDMASEYARVRAETAEEAGEPADAVEWQAVEQKLDSPDDDGKGGD